MSKLLSIVIPVYNMSAYLAQTLDSVACCADRGDLLEAIVVNDGSTDDSLRIALEYRDRYPGLFTVIDKPNGGHGSAWNAGVEAATGLYTAFLDSDDWMVGLDAYLEASASFSSDLVFNDCVIFDESTGRSTREKIKGIAPGRHSLEDEPLPLDRFDPRMCNFHYCIYRTRILKDLHPLFGEHTSYDDMILFVAPIVEGSTYEYSSLPLYCYRVSREGQSMDAGVISRKIDQQIAQRKYLISFVHDHAPLSQSKTAQLAIVIRSVCVTCYNFLMHLEPERRRNYLDMWTEYIDESVPEARDIFEKRSYERLPWALNVLALKVHHLFRRLSRAMR